MRIADYQKQAARTDQFPTTREPQATKGKEAKAELVPLLGLTGEVGTLLSEYKKVLRDGPVHLRFTDRVAEELGDILWYVSTVATKFGLSLDDIARQNLKKVEDRWSRPSNRRSPFDSTYPRRERLPRSFRYRFSYRYVKGAKRVSLLDRNGRDVGNPLTDNAHVPDGYRFHDVMHFAFVAILGWSATARGLLKRKRKSRRKIDEVEDGGRAVVIDEAIVAMIFDYAGGNIQATDGLRAVDTEMLRSIRRLTRGLEVHSRTEGDWERAILRGLSVWRQVDRHDGGTIVGDFHRGHFGFIPPRRTGAPGRRRRQSNHQSRPRS